MPVLLQYAIDDGPILLYEIWYQPIQETLELIEKITKTDVVGFNLTFDWFMLCKTYTIFSLCDPNWVPEEHIEEIALLEPLARFGPCLKPKRALDLMLVAKRGKYQSLMDRKDIKIRKVPEAIAYKLAEHLERSVKIDDIYFSRRKDKYAPRWAVRPSILPGFKDVILKFAASGALKTLAQHALKVPRSEILKHADVEVDKKHRPVEYGWAPFALAVGKPGKWRGAWPEVAIFHLEHWRYNSLARKYATDDVDYTRRLDEFFGHPEAGDVDSTLACMVAAVRWRGFKIDPEKIKAQREQIKIGLKDVPIAPKPARYWITEPMEEVERMQVTSTKRTVLEELATLPCDCTFDAEIKNCSICNGSKLHPSAQRAKVILEARQALHRDKIYEKLQQANHRFHASFKITGTLSNRMAGTDGLNAQGFERLKTMRSCFTLADEGYVLSGGDFDSFEVVIAEAMYNDPELHKVLTEKYPCCRDPNCDDCLGTGYTTKKLHALFGLELSGLDYAGVMATKGNPTRDWYATGKAGVLSKIYGGDWGTLVRKHRIPEDIAKAADEAFEKKYKGIREARKTIIDMFCSMRQPGGIGTRVEWYEPAEKVESLLGFPRYFILENSICRSLFYLAQNCPKDWKEVQGRVMRTDRKQTAAGATCSALYGAAFGIQSNAMRAAANHRIQATGAEVTKKLQANIWSLQPCGVHPFKVILLNAHDEVLCCSLPEIVQDVKRIADETVESYKALISLLKMTWKTKMASWAEK
jgi:hypothetical protein